MNILGISGRRRDAAAAISVEGRVVSAASEDYFAKVIAIGYEDTGGSPGRAIDACLQRAGLNREHIDRVALVADGTADTETSPVVRAEDEWSKGHVVSVPALRADAMVAAASVEECAGVLIWSQTPPAAASFVCEGGNLVARQSIAGTESLVAAIGTFAAALGLNGDEPLAALDRLGQAGEPEFEADVAATIEWTRSGFSVDAARVREVIDRVNRDSGGALSQRSSLNVPLQHRRRALAASVTRRLARVAADAIGAVAEEIGSDRLVCGGGFFTHARLNTELRRLTNDHVFLAAVPGPVGRALGAVLAEDGSPAGKLRSLALGPAYTDAEIKRTLDNCRLDYLYEPDWPRLIDRASRLLAQGKVVAWFQGAMGFGTTTSGSRSVLADPSGRYARPNLNEYLRDVPVDEPLPVTLAPSRADECLIGGMPRSAGAFDVAVTPAMRERLGAALDSRGSIRVRAGELGPGAEFVELLEAHSRLTGTPGLIEIDLASAEEPIACTPRDAVRIMFSSAIDVLVMGRFVLMKDYWLLRSRAD